MSYMKTCNCGKENWLVIHYTNTITVRLNPRNAAGINPHIQ